MKADTFVIGIPFIQYENVLDEKVIVLAGLPNYYSAMLEYAPQALLKDPSCNCRPTPHPIALESNRAGEKESRNLKEEKVIMECKEQSTEFCGFTLLFWSDYNPSYAIFNIAATTREVKRKGRYRRYPGSSKLSVSPAGGQILQGMHQTHFWTSFPSQHWSCEGQCQLGLEKGSSTLLSPASLHHVNN